MPTKEQYIIELETKKKRIKANLTQGYEDLKKIKQRFFGKSPKNNKEYIFIKKQHHLFSKFYARVNYYEWQYFSIISDLLKARLSSNQHVYDSLNRHELFQYISFIEKYFTKNIVPINFHIVQRINRLVARMNRLLIKSIYIKHTKSNKPNITEIQQRLSAIRCSNLIAKIDAIKQYIDDIKTKHLNMFHSSLVRELEKKNRSYKPQPIDTQKDVVVLKNVSKYYITNTLATKVLEDINLTVKQGEFVVILGPSGSGKTTLLNLISGMDRPSYGDVIVNNQYISTYNNEQLTSFRRQTLGYIFQQYGLLPNLTARENVEIGQNLQPSGEVHLDIDEILHDVDIYDFRNKLPNEMSGGQQQRVSIARSLAKNPKIIFGDEPTGAVDEQMTKKIMKLFVEINRKYKTTIVIVTHNSLFAQLATKVIKIKNHRIIELISNQKQKSVDEIKW
ncbi:MAG: ABC transporter ATP-binding protein [Mycoplasmataceae bacterium]|nr:ABC transporter ATP-binding protein [Mycoplasmataceae bacterium]